MDNVQKHIDCVNSLFDQNSKLFNDITSGTYSYHCVLKCLQTRDFTNKILE
jgi:hypothetical protein